MSADGINSSGKAVTSDDVTSALRVPRLAGRRSATVKGWFNRLMFGRPMHERVGRAAPLLVAMYRLSGDISHLGEAIRYFQFAITQTPQGHGDLIRLARSPVEHAEQGNAPRRGNPR